MFFFQITWARLNSNHKLESVLTIGKDNYVEDKRFFVSKPQILNTKVVSNDIENSIRVADKKK